jgi:hypothetical protein
MRALGADSRFENRFPVALAKNENGLPSGKPSIYLVAGEGFEPSTFGL